MTRRMAGDPDVLRLLAADRDRLNQHGALTEEDLGTPGRNEGYDPEALIEALEKDSADPRYEYVVDPHGYGDYRLHGNPVPPGLPDGVTDVVALARELTGQYDLDIQPAGEMAPVALHDGAHRFINTGVDEYGEVLQSAADKAMLNKLYGDGLIYGNPPYYGTRRKDLHPPDVPSKGSFVNYDYMPDDPGMGLAYHDKVNQRIQEELNDFLSNPWYVEEESGDPTQELWRQVHPQDVRTAEARAEALATALLNGYRQAVREGRYSPQRSAVDGMVHAADLADAVMSGQVLVGRGWADEELFPHHPALLKKGAAR